MLKTIGHVNSYKLIRVNCIKLAYNSWREEAFLYMFYKQHVVKNFEEFTGKHLLRSVFFQKLKAGDLELYEKKTPVQVCSFEFCKSFKSTFFIEYLRSVASKLLEKYCLCEKKLSKKANYWEFNLKSESNMEYITTKFQEKSSLSLFKNEMK